MKELKTGLIGLGAIGVPIAHKMYRKYGKSFSLVLSGDRRKKFENAETMINGEQFKPDMISSKEELEKPLDLLVICVKNYDLKSSLPDVRAVVSDETVIMPLENGIAAYLFYREQFPQNVVLEGYMQGPNTVRIPEGFSYQNPGTLHIGTSNPKLNGHVEEVFSIFHEAKVPVIIEKDIRHMVWKKWMLNVAGNSITALTGADYSLFKIYEDLQIICRQAMEEFLRIAQAEGVDLTEKDIRDILNYYISYIGSKKTSMLEDVIRENKTENDYLAGTAVQLANKHGIEVPTISTLYYLMEIKEEVYMEKKGVRSTKNLFTEGVEYSDALRVNMNDIAQKMEDPEYALEINSGKGVKELRDLLNYVTENSEYYSYLKGKELSLSDFPVMNEKTLNDNYDTVLVHSFDHVKTHKMYTSGSTGVPFQIVQDLGKRERHIADLKYFGTLAGYADHDPMCYLRARPTATTEQQKIDNIWQLDISNLSHKNLTDYYHVMTEKRCTALFGYASTLETAVDFWSKTFKNDSCVKTIISTSETLTDEVKEKLRNFFGPETGIYARYSNTENGILGQETGESGRYKLNWASYYFEILKLESDEPAADGELGRIIVTDLYNKAFPMIRYDTGDVAVMEKKGEDELPEFVELFGRRMDLIYDTKGEVVSPFLLCRTMRLFQGIEQWQFIQDEPKKYTLKITANTEEKPNVDKEVASFLDTLGHDAEFNVEYVENIPVMNSLKRKLIVSKLKK